MFAYDLENVDRGTLPGAAGGATGTAGGTARAGAGVTGAVRAGGAFGAPTFGAAGAGALGAAGGGAFGVTGGGGAAAAPAPGVNGNNRLLTTACTSRLNRQSINNKLRVRVSSRFSSASVGS